MLIDAKFTIAPPDANISILIDAKFTIAPPDANIPILIDAALAVADLDANFPRDVPVEGAAFTFTVNHM